MSSERFLKKIWNKIRYRVRYRIRCCSGGWQSWHGIDFPPRPRKRVSIHRWRGRLKKKVVIRQVFPPSRVGHEVVPFLAPHPAFEAPQWQKNVAEFPALPVYEIPRARTASKNGAVITDDNVLLSELSPLPLFDCQDGMHPLLRPREGEYPARRVVRKKGVYGLAHSVINATYHWLFETLPRLELLRRAGYTWDKLDGIFIRKPRYETHFATLDLLGIPPEKIIWCTANTHYAADLIISGTVPVDDRFHPAWVHSFLRSLPGFPLDEYLGCRKRLLVSRGEEGVSRRRVVNQAEVAQSLKCFGFEEVQLATLPFVEQARLFASAEWIVAPHGAGLSNLVFSPPGAKVIEIFAPDYTPVTFRNLSWEAGLHYQPLMASAVETGEVCRLGKDIRVDVAALHALFRKMEESLAC